MSKNTAAGIPEQRHANRAQANEHFGLLRFSHIFASAVREVLEVKCLREVSPDSLTVSQFHLLKLISLNGNHHVGEVAGFLGVSPPAATKNIDKLERLGLVMRSPSSGDRRATILSSSAKGRRLVERFEAHKERRLATVLAKFSSEEIEQLTGLLERFSLGLIRQEKADGKLCLRCSAYYDDHCPVRHFRDGCPYQKIRQAHGSQAAAGSLREPQAGGQAGAP